MDMSMFTMVTYLYKQPKKFLGGELILPETGHVLEPVFNRTYIIPSYTTHEVTAIQMDEQDAKQGYGRYCVSNFLNFRTGA
jgi:Rps23 Pro-64 3,4-dihydroxylase Tpa1-like proline 4-hydroxylase